MKMTAQRRVIARVLSDSDDHPDVEEVHRRAMSVDASVSMATVYRTVRLFEEAGILEKHDFGDGRSRYEEASDEHHDHIINVKTREVIEFTNEEIEMIQRRIAKNTACAWSIIGSNSTACRSIRIRIGLARRAIWYW